MSWDFVHLLIRFLLPGSIAEWYWEDYCRWEVTRHYLIWASQSTRGGFGPGAGLKFTVVK